MKFYLVKNLQYAKDIYKLNNSFSVRKYSTHNKRFAYHSHLKWMRVLIKKKKAFILISKNNLIGFIKSEKIRDKFFLSWAISKKSRNKGYGKIMLKYICKKSKQTYHAKIMKKNIFSLNMCLKCNFKIYYSNKIYYFLKN